MSQIFQIDLNWKRTKEFTYETYNRDHTITMGGNQIIKNTAAVEYFGSDDMTNPEELLASAVSSCHLMSFLAVAAKSGYVVESYFDIAVATLGKNEEGRIFVKIIDLAPKIIFSGNKIPDAEQLKSLHEKAHRVCFIANSIKTKVNVL